MRFPDTSEVAPRTGRRSPRCPRYINPTSADLVPFIEVAARRPYQPHREIPEDEVIQLRHKPRDAGLEGGPRFCEQCDAQVPPSGWNTGKTLSQAAYLAAYETFNADEQLQMCPNCAMQRPTVDHSASNWVAVAQQLGDLS